MTTVAGARVLAHEQAARLLFAEARLLDEDRLEEWLEMYTDDATWWIPIEDDPHPDVHVSILFDDRARMHARIARLRTGFAYAQVPASRVQRSVSNIEVEATNDEGDFDIRCVTVMFELRAHVQTVYPARCSYRARRVGDEWKLASKRVDLLARREVVDNLSFVV